MLTWQHSCAALRNGPSSRPGVAIENVERRGPASCLARRTRCRRSAAPRKLVILALFPRSSRRPEPRVSRVGSRSATRHARLGGGRAPSISIIGRVHDAVLAGAGLVAADDVAPLVAPFGGIACAWDGGGMVYRSRPPLPYLVLKPIVSNPFTSVRPAGECLREFEEPELLLYRLRAGACHDARLTPCGAQWVGAPKVVCPNGDRLRMQCN